MPVPVAREQQIIKESTFREDMTFSPEYLREWFTTNEVVRTMAHLFAFDGTKDVRVRVSESGYLLTEGEKQHWSYAVFTSVSNTYYTVATNTVPENEIWVLEHVYVCDRTSTGGSVLISLSRLTEVLRLQYVSPMVTGEPVLYQGPMYLFYGTKVVVELDNLQIGDYIDVMIKGYKIVRGD